MSKYIDEIVKDIRNNPESWTRFENSGLKKDDIIVAQCGNGHILFLGWITSIVEVRINGKHNFGFMSYIDKIKLEEAFQWWMSKANIKMMQA